MKTSPLATAVVALSILVAGAGCGSSSGRSGTASPSPATGNAPAGATSTASTTTPAATPSSGEGTASTAATAGTRVAYAAPVDGTGQLLRSMVVTSQTSGSCEPGSDVIGNVEVYRCFGGNYVYDPCWWDRSASPAGVVCMDAPWSSDVTRIAAAGVSPEVDVQTTDLGSPWAVQLTSGARCLALQGAHSYFEGKVVDFGCNGGPVQGLSLLRAMNRSGPRWTYQTVEDRPGGATVAGPTVQVATAWYAGPPPPSGSPACSGSAISITTANGPAPGSVYLVFRNSGSATCTLGGYPGVAALDSAGRQVSQAQRSSPVQGPATVYVPAGGSASAEVQTPSGSSAASCPAYPALLVTPPNTTTSTRVPVAGVKICGSFEVAPVGFGNLG